MPAKYSFCSFQAKLGPERGAANLSGSDQGNLGYGCGGSTGL
jgi:hypothetical protein